MARKDAVPISRKTLAWAIKRAGLTHEQLAKALGKGYTAGHVIAWESGDVLPTLVQAERIAEKLRIPFGVLFMENPPEITVPIPDLRTVSGESPPKPSIGFFEVTGESRSRQRWYRELRDRKSVV